MIALYQTLTLEKRHAHLNANGSGQSATRDHASIIVAKDNDRLMLQRCIEDCLAGDIEIVAIDESERVRLHLLSSVRPSEEETA
jgi:hypothetical protein